MKHANRRTYRWVGCVLALMLLFSVFAGCSTVGEKNTNSAAPTKQDMDQHNGRVETESKPGAEPTDKPKPSSSDGKDVPEVIPGGFEGRDDIQYVLIYNPDIYNENYYYNDTLYTGDIGDEIDISMFRADELEPFEPEIIPYTQSNYQDIFDGVEFDFDDARAGVMQPIIRKGDTRSFNVSLYNCNGARAATEFVCLYSGAHCCVWSYRDSITENEADEIGKKFDNYIYDEVVDTFGTPRYADDGGVIHLLYYPLQAHLGGFFSPIDLFSTEEVSGDYDWVQAYAPNLDLAVIHFNSDMVAPRNMDSIYSTTAHEFQHLINFTDSIECPHTAYSIRCNGTWINEAMSGYIEEALFAGVKEDEGHYYCFERSNLVRHGQSMFNFTVTDGSNFGEEFDIGVYGSVFLFSNYLESNAGDQVFKKMHNYWRYTNSYLWDDAAAIYSAVPDSFIAEINSAYTYPDTVRFETDEQAWMSKMVLDFYLSLLQSRGDCPAVYHNVESQLLLYDEINPADIEGGGRVIAATVDGTFEIPDDADYGLIYVGLDANFCPVTDLIYK